MEAVTVLSRGLLSLVNSISNIIQSGQTANDSSC